MIFLYIYHLGIDVAKNLFCVNTWIIKAKPDSQISL